MDVHSPISSVIPTLDGPVLEALAGTIRPLRLTDVHRLAGTGSLSGVRRVLVRLTSHGLVDEVPGGYLLNRDHIACPAVLELSGLWGRCLERIRQAVGQWPQPPVLLGLFGSAARRDGDADSDIDLLVVADFVGAEEYGAELSEAVERWTGNATHVVSVTRADLRRMRRARERVLTEWDRDLVVVTGDREVLRG